MGGKIEKRTLLRFCRFRHLTMSYKEFLEMADNIDFCCCCNCWIAADTGTMRVGSDGEAEIVCDECKRIEQRQVMIEHDARNGKLND